MERQDRTLTTRDGLPQATYIWAPDAQPKAVLVLTHGAGEYASKYGHVGQTLNAAGYALVAYDLRGFGRSGGPRGHTPSYAALLDDLDGVLAMARAAFPARPVFLYGHSMGGQITLNYCIQRQPAVAGVVVSAPWIKLIYMPPAWKVTLARALAGVWPTFTQDTGLDGAVPMTHDTALLAAYPDQHLRHGFMSARLGNDAMVQGEALLERAGQLRLPLLVLHGDADGVFAPTTSRMFVERAASTDKTLYVYPGLYHEIHNEIERAQVLRDLVTWLDAHRPPASV